MYRGIQVVESPKRCPHDVPPHRNLCQWQDRLGSRGTGTRVQTYPTSEGGVPMPEAPRSSALMNAGIKPVARAFMDGTAIIFQDNLASCDDEGLLDRYRIVRIARAVCPSGVTIQSATTWIRALRVFFVHVSVAPAMPATSESSAFNVGRATGSRFHFWGMSMSWAAESLRKMYLPLCATRRSVGEVFFRIGWALRCLVCLVGSIAGINDGVVRS